MLRTVEPVGLLWVEAELEIAVGLLRVEVGIEAVQGVVRAVEDAEVLEIAAARRDVVDVGAEERLGAGQGVEYLGVDQDSAFEVVPDAAFEVVPDVASEVVPDVAASEVVPDVAASGVDQAAFEVDPDVVGIVAADRDDKPAVREFRASAAAGDPEAAAEASCTDWRQVEHLHSKDTHWE